MQRTCGEQSERPVEEYVDKSNFTMTKIERSNPVQDPSCSHVGNRGARQRQVCTVIHWPNFHCACLHKLPTLSVFKIPKSYLEENGFV